MSPFRPNIQHLAQKGDVQGLLRIIQRERKEQRVADAIGALVLLDSDEATHVVLRFLRNEWSPDDRKAMRGRESELRSKIARMLRPQHKVWRALANWFNSQSTARIERLLRSFPSSQRNCLLPHLLKEPSQKVIGAVLQLNSKVVAAAVECVAAQGEGDSVPALLDALQNQKHAWARDTAALVLAQLGDSRAIQPLVRAVELLRIDRAAAETVLEKLVHRVNRRDVSRCVSVLARDCVMALIIDCMDFVAESMLIRLLQSFASMVPLSVLQDIDSIPDVPGTPGRRVMKERAGGRVGRILHVGWTPGVSHTHLRELAWHEMTRRRE